MALCVLLLGLCGCVFEPPPAVGPDSPPPPPFNLPYPFGDAPSSPVSDSGEKRVFEDPGSVVVDHGFACAESKEPDTQRILRVQQSFPLPSGMDRATVFLSGWRFAFLNGDHKLQALGTGIFNIRLENGQLSWEAVGGIADDDYDDPYRWCYHYTRLAWSRAAFAAGRDDRDQLSFASTNASGWDTALTYYRRSVDTLWAGQYLPTNAAILPRGFSLAWEPGTDRHLLQLAYNLDYSEGFERNVVDLGAASSFDQVAGRVHSWETKTILKDNALRRDHYAGEIVSVIAGPAVQVVQPPFTIVPVEDGGSCDEGSKTDSDIRRKIDNVPFDVAIPILTGWDVLYACDDENVEEIGIWIDDVTYSPPSAGVNGTLEYALKAVLHDDGRNDTAVFRHRLGILGLERMPPAR